MTTDAIEPTHPTEAPTGRTFNGPRCHATARNGERAGLQCGNPALPGATVCRFHGGAAPQVLTRAKLRLLDLVDPGIARLQRIITDPTSDDADAIRAWNSIADRVGLVRQTSVDASTAQMLLIERIREAFETRFEDGSTVQGEVVEP